MKNIVNEFRYLNGKQGVGIWDTKVSEYCQLHNLEMSKRKSIFHTDFCFLGDWQEIVVACSYAGEKWGDIQRKLIFDIISQSGEHKNILLNSSILAYSFCVFDYVAYLTIRGK